MASLRIIKLFKKEYYFDERLKQIRNVKNPCDYYQLTDIELLLLKNEGSN